MKKQIKNLIKAIPLLALFVFCNFANAQNVSITIQNLIQTDPKIIEFDVFIKDVNFPPNPTILYSLQNGFNVNSLISGGTLTATIDNSTTDLVTAQKFVAAVGKQIIGNPTNLTVFKLAGPGISCNGGTTLSTTGNGTLETHYIITSSVAFTPGTFPNITFNNSANSPYYGTKVSICNGGVPLAIAINNPTVNATVIGNPSLIAVQSSDIAFGCPTNNLIDVSWTNGGGGNHVVFAKQGTGTITKPVNNTTYTASTDWNSKGTQLSSSGYYCIYNGAGSNVTLKNLLPGTQYTFQVYDYNGGVGSESYLVSTATNNPNSTTTIATGTTWTGATSTNWTVAGNWSNGVPTSGMDVYISASTSSPHVNAAMATPAECKDIHICPNATLYVDPQCALTSYGIVTNNGQFIISSTNAGTGSYIDKGGSSDMVGSGSYIFQRYLPSVQWMYVSSPVQFGTAGNFPGLSSTANQGTRLWYWDEPSHSFPAAITSTSYALNPVRGYAAKVWTGGAQTAAFTGGTFNTGACTTGSTGLTYTAGTSHGFNLVGNPYPSAIDWGLIANSEYGPTQHNITPTIWYRHNSQYCTYNGQSGACVNSGSMPAQRMIPAGEAFYVRVLSSAGGGVDFTNANRQHNTQAFYKTAQESNIFRLKVAIDTINDETAVGFYQDAQDVMENFDSEKMFNTTDDVPQVYTLTTDSTEVAINGFPELTANTERIVPLGIDIPVAGPATFEATNLNDFDANISIYLEDLQQNVLQDLRQNNTYSFTSGIVNNANRFRLHFNLLTTDVPTVKDAPISIYSYNSAVYVNTPMTSGDVICVYDLLGNLIASQKSVQGLNKLPLNVVRGIYIVKVQSKEQLITNKVIVSK